MTYQEAVNYNDEFGKDLEYDKKKNIDFIVFIAPTDPKRYEDFTRNFVLNHYNPNVIFPYANSDVCFMRVAKKYLNHGAFVYEVIKS